MNKIKIIHIAGARPNFMKTAPLMKEFARYSHIKQILVHTGQHYDKEMSQFFLKDLKIPKPNIHLGVGSLSHSAQTAKIMEKLEPVFTKEKPSLIIVVGDVNSTLAAALTAVKMRIPIAHIEAGLRSFDKAMPEEINRLLTDAVSDYLFVTEESGVVNLCKEGVPRKKIFLVGNTMIDTLLKFKPKAAKSKIVKKLALNNKQYAVLTLHRPSNVDQKQSFLKIIQPLSEIAKDMPIIFPCHPRTEKVIKKFRLNRYFNFFGRYQTYRRGRISLVKPLGYIDFLRLMMGAKVVFTDSGGIQEETTILNIPCITLRNTTERPSTLLYGTNVLVHNDARKIKRYAYKALKGEFKQSRRMKLWDGKAAKRIAKILVKKLT